MTLRLRRKRPTTRPCRLLVMAISGLLFTLNGSLLAAPPVVPVPASPQVPTPQVPGTLLPPNMPRPQLVPADASPYPNRGVPTQTMTYQKPAGGTAAMPVSQQKLPPKTGGMAGTGVEPTIKPGSSPIDTYFQDRSRVFRLDNDEIFNQRIIDEIQQEAKERRDRSKAPGDMVAQPGYYAVPPVVSVVPKDATMQPRAYAPTQLLIEPSCVVLRKLLFEELNAERYGWDLGIVQPVVSTAHFFGDVLLWPARVASNVREAYETSAGKCPPGSPLPYAIYPPNVTPFGAIVGAATIGGTIAIFP